MKAEPHYSATDTGRSGTPAISMVLSVLFVMAMVTGCTTHSYYKDRHTLVTVKKFIGIPYLIEEEKTVTRPVE